MSKMKPDAALRAENRRLRKALRVYADPDNWRAIGAACSNPDHQRNLFVIQGWDGLRDDWHGWAIAANALKGTR